MTRRKGKRFKTVRNGQQLSRRRKQREFARNFEKTVAAVRAHLEPEEEPLDQWAKKWWETDIARPKMIDGPDLIAALLERE